MNVNESPHPQTRVLKLSCAYDGSTFGGWDYHNPLFEPESYTLNPKTRNEAHPTSKDKAAAEELDEFLLLYPRDPSIQIP